MHGKLVTIRIDPKTYQTARELGLNISKTCENSLKQAIQLLTASEQQNNCISTCEGTSQQRRLVGRAGFEPATFCTSSRCPNRARLPALLFSDLEANLGFSDLCIFCVSVCVSVTNLLYSSGSFSYLPR
jgi:post-segregation antitoxin (ccd killing protein)